MEENYRELLAPNQIAFPVVETIEEGPFLLLLNRNKNPAALFFKNETMFFSFWEDGTASGVYLREDGTEIFRFTENHPKPPV